MIESDRDVVIRYRYAEENLFAKESEIRKSIKDIENQVAMLRQRYEDKRSRIEKKRLDLKSVRRLCSKISHIDETD